MNAPIAIIGDVHGCFYTLQTLVEQLPADATLYFTGDLIDRGPHSMAVVQWVRQQGWHTLLGNHEWMMYQALEDPFYRQLWLLNGGQATLNDLFHHAHQAGRSPQEVLSDLAQWARNLPLYFLIPVGQQQLLITHAGILPLPDWRTALTIPLDDDRSVIWYRGPLGQWDGIVQICGHTPVPNGPKQEGPNWRIDTGCVYDHPGLGYLSALVWHPGRVQPDIIRVPRDERDQPAR